MSEHKIKHRNLHEEEKKKIPPEKMQNIAGMAVIGIITVALCLCGLFGGDDSVKTDKDVTTTSSATTTTTTTAALPGADAPIDSTSSESQTTTTTTTAQTTTPSETTTTPKETTTEAKSTTTTAKQTTTKKPQTSTAKQTTTAKVTTTTAKQTTTAKVTTTTAKKTTTTTTTTTKKPASQGKLSATANSVESWGEGSQISTKIVVSIKNATKSAVDGWTVTMKVPAGAKITQGWGGVYSISGTTLTIKPADYNKVIEAGKEISDIGFIIEASEKVTSSATVK